jgi:hypothetical protein
VLFKNQVSTPQKIKRIYIAKNNQLMLSRETTTVYCKKHTKHINTLQRNKLSIYNVTANSAKRHLTETATAYLLA